MQAAGNEWAQRSARTAWDWPPGWGVGAVAYLEALRWGTLGMLRGWAELRKLM